MTSLSITAAWNETAAYVRRHAGLLFLIAFGLIALPTVIFQALAPRAAPGETPELGLWVLFIVPLMVLTVLGSLTLTALALGEGEPRDAFRRALRRFPSVIVAALLLGLAVVVCAFPLIILAASVTSSETSLTALTALIIIGAFLFLWVRLMLINPVAAAEEGGPVAILKRSWGMTRGHFGRLFGLVLLLGLAVAVLSLAVASVAGSLIVLVAGQPDPGSLSSVLMLLLAGVLNAALSICFTVLVARVYVQLSGKASTATGDR